MTRPDRTWMDRPELVQFLFHPRQEHCPPPPGARDYPVRVEPGLWVSTRLYLADGSSPTILYFHGNGEIVADHDEVAPLYLRKGLNLLVADYRGYGASGGSPTFSNMLSDAHVVLDATTKLLESSGYNRDLFVMGRSLGSAPAIELAADHSDKLLGLIVESGFASAARLLGQLGLPAQVPDEAALPNLSTVRRTALPTLVIHGEWDGLIPLSEGEALYSLSPAEDKRLLIIPRAGHNDILLADTQLYMSAIADFVRAHRRRVEEPGA